MGTGNDEVKHEKTQLEPVSTTLGGTSLVLLNVYFQKDGG